MADSLKTALVWVAPWFVKLLNMLKRYSLWATIAMMRGTPTCLLGKHWLHWSISSSVLCRDSPSLMIVLTKLSEYVRVHSWTRTWCSASGWWQPFVLMFSRFWDVFLHTWQPLIKGMCMIVYSASGLCWICLPDVTSKQAHRQAPSCRWLTRMNFMNQARSWDIRAKQFPALIM